jgi:glycosyltransferase involved in cell wall biosynthesis
VRGGTALAPIGTARALRGWPGCELIGVAARHRSPPPEPWVPPIPVTHLGLPRILLYEAWHRLRSPRVERAAGAVDAIHATSLAIPPKTAPLLVTVHDLLFLHQPESFTRRGLRFLRRGLKLTMRDADLVLCPSEATKRDCERAGFDSRRIRLVPLGVEARPAGSSDVERVRARYGLERPYLLWVGTIEPRKNLRGLLEGYRRAAPRADLVLAGPRGWREDLDALIGDAGGAVKRLGFVPAADLPALYAGAEAFCFPSLAEGFGFPVLEAMAQDTPVITSRGTSTEEIAGGAAALVDPLDPAEIGEAITAVTEDRSLGERLAVQGRQQVRRYTWQRTAEATARAYSEVAAASSAPAPSGEAGS